MPDLLEIRRDILSERLPAGYGNRIYIATDEDTGYWDDGIAWQRFCGNLYQLLTAAEYLPPYSAVQADGHLARAGDAVYGFTLAGALPGQPVKVFAAGAWANPAWFWIPGQPIYIDGIGALTQTRTVTQIAVALSRTVLALTPQAMAIGPDRILTAENEVLVQDGYVLWN